ERIKGSLNALISSNQSAFVPGRRISDNILLTHELMHNYHLDRGSPRCAFKGNIQKAYDTVDWNFLKLTLLAFGFHTRMVAWIMKLLTLMLHRKVRDSEMFTFHRYCADLDLINFCFADDLFLFAHGDVDSAKVIMDALDEFKLASGLTPSLPKSTAYFCNVLNHVKIAILHVLPFEEGRLPVKYLGFLWFRLGWSIEIIMRGFLWCQGLLKKGKANVSWDIVCRKRIEGGLGVRRIYTFNKALMVSHLWNLISSKESLWVKWIHVYKLKGHSFWEVSCRSNLSWGWRKILQLRPLIREFIWYRIGDGLTASAWFDSWCHVGPISRITQDLLRHWDVNTRLVSSCSLCGGQPDSHNHLFFKCGYSTQVWDHMKDLAALSNVVGGYKDVVDFLTSYANRRSCKSVIAKLVFSASVYYIWQDYLFGESVY
ncbi:hypothetical protein Tco_0865352, partial [Tanacetum coccineum]